jgi:hypothetical protein
MPDGIQPSPWPPVVESAVMLICMRGPATTPSSTACLTPKSAPPASRTVVMPASMRAPHAVDGLVEAQREGSGHQLGDVDPFQHHMDVGVDHPRQDEATLRVDQRNIAGGLSHLAAPPNTADRSAFHQQRGIGNRRAAVAIDQRAVVNEGEFRHTVMLLV